MHRQAIAAADRIGDGRWKAIFQSNLGRSLLAQGQPETALQLLEESLVVSRSLNDQETVARTLTRLGEVYLRQGRLAEAETVGKEAEMIARKWGYRKGQADAQMIRAEAARAQNDTDTADRYLRDAQKLYAILHDPLADELARTSGVN